MPLREKQAQSHPLPPAGASKPKGKTKKRTNRKSGFDAERRGGALVYLPTLKRLWHKNPSNSPS